MLLSREDPLATWTDDRLAGLLVAPLVLALLQRELWPSPAPWLEALLELSPGATGGLLLAPWPIHCAHSGSACDSVAQHIDRTSLESASGSQAARVRAHKLS